MAGILTLGGKNLTSEMFALTMPCADCPFRKEGGVRHPKKMMEAYITYFVEWPGASFPCHRSVPADDPRSAWSEWRDGQVFCAGGIAFALKQGRENVFMAVAAMNGYFKPELFQAALPLVFDSGSQMLGEEE
jgi:hypothetical protein